MMVIPYPPVTIQIWEQIRANPSELKKTHSNYSLTVAFDTQDG